MYNLTASTTTISTNGNNLWSGCYIYPSTAYPWIGTIQWEINPYYYCYLYDPSVYYNTMPFNKNDDGTYSAEFELAGVKRDDISVTFTDKTLVLKSPKKEITSTFPKAVDNVDATYVDGLLTLVVRLKVEPVTTVVLK